MVRRGPQIPREKPKPPTDEEILAESLSASATSLEVEAAKVLKPDQIKILKRIAYYVGKVGMDLEEACTLLDVPFEQFKIDMETTPIVKKIITLKLLEFKKDLMATLAMRARDGDDKLALELLARRYPAEFGEQKKKRGPEGERDFLQEAIVFIRQGRREQPLINEDAGRAIVVTHKSSNGPIEKIGEILGRDTVQIIPAPVASTILSPESQPE